MRHTLLALAILFEVIPTHEAMASIDEIFFEFGDRIWVFEGTRTEFERLAARAAEAGRNGWAYVWPLGNNAAARPVGGPNASLSGLARVLTPSEVAQVQSRGSRIAGRIFGSRAGQIAGALMRGGTSALGTAARVGASALSRTLSILGGPWVAAITTTLTDPSELGDDDDRLGCANRLYAMQNRLRAYMTTREAAAGLQCQRVAAVQRHAPQSVIDGLVRLREERVTQFYRLERTLAERIPYYLQVSPCRVYIDEEILVLRAFYQRALQANFLEGCNEQTGDIVIVEPTPQPTPGAGAGHPHAASLPTATRAPHGAH